MVAQERANNINGQLAQLHGELSILQRINQVVLTFLSQIGTAKLETANAVNAAEQSLTAIKAFKDAKINCNTMKADVIASRLLYSVSPPNIVNASPPWEQFQGSPLYSEMFPDFPSHELLTPWNLLVDANFACAPNEIKSLETAFEHVKIAPDAEFSSLMTYFTNYYKATSERAQTAIITRQKQIEEDEAELAKLDSVMNASNVATTSVLQNVVWPMVAVLILLYTITLLFPGLIQRSLIEYRTLVEMVGIAFVLIVVMSLGTANKLSETTLGTLLGSIASYIFGQQLGRKESSRNAHGDGQEAPPSPQGSGPAPAPGAPGVAVSSKTPSVDVVSHAEGMARGNRINALVLTIAAVGLGLGASVSGDRVVSWVLSVMAIVVGAYLFLTIGIEIAGSTPKPVRARGSSKQWSSPRTKAALYSAVVLAGVAWSLWSTRPTWVPYAATLAAIAALFGFLSGAQGEPHSGPPSSPPSTPPSN